MTFNLTKLALAASAVGILATSWVGLTSPETKHADPANPKLDKLKLQPGFKAEHLYSPSDNKQGSWVAMTFDNKGRIITSDQYGFLYRMTLPPIGSTQKATVQKLDIPAIDGQVVDSVVGMGYAQGLLYAFNSLYVMVNHRADSKFKRGSGLYRLQDTNGDEQFDKITLLKALNGEGEHGPHSIVMAPDKKSLYVICGNHTDAPKMDAYRLPPTWKEDNLFPQIKDPRGHAADRKAPGGYIVHIDSLGKRWELVSAGYRNAFDFAFNEAGDMLVYDADMEWDFGLPWYRPTRIVHATSGSEFGWRTGNGKWYPSYPDNLPPVINIGQGSPTSVAYSSSSKFPKKYQNTLFAFDWSFGIIHAIHLTATGSTYKGQDEEFLSGAPLPLTDGVFGPDGALYFMTGGRRLDSDVYRVYYAGSDAPNSFAVATPTLSPEHKLRTSLEQYHAGPNPAALAAAWPQLNHPDRFVRYAARMAVEHQPVAQWKEKALTETDPVRATQAVIALVRSDSTDTSLKNRMLNRLLAIDLGKLSEPQQLDVLRAYELVFVRRGEPDAAEKSKLIAALNPRYPANTALLNRAYSKLLIFLEAPGVAEKTLTLMDRKGEGGSEIMGGEMSTASSDVILRNPQYGLDIAGMLEKVPPAQQTFYAIMMSRLASGWTTALRDRYFKWFANAFTYKGGRSYVGFLDRARKMALTHVPKEEVAKYDKMSGGELLTQSGNDLASNYTPKGPRQMWTLPKATALMDSGLTGRDFQRGKDIYGAILCSSCHSMQGEGKDIGPDLTQLGTRFSPKDILEAIIDPNKAVSDQYAATIFTLKSGKSIVGRLSGEDKTNYLVSQNPFAPDYLEKVPKKDVVSKKYSMQSIMLPGLINSLGPDELRDLMAYLVAGGNPKNKLYTAAPNNK